MKKIADFFRQKGAGFYISLVGAVFLLVCAIVYAATFSVNEHIYLNFDAGALIFMIFGAIAFCALSVFKVTEKYAAAALFVGDFAGFLLFIRSSYLYFSDVFFEVEADAIGKAIASMDKGFAFTLVVLILVWIFSTVGIFANINKKKKSEEIKNEEISD